MVLRVWLVVKIGSTRKGNHGVYVCMTSTVLEFWWEIIEDLVKGSFEFGVCTFHLWLYALHRSHYLSSSTLS